LLGPFPGESIWRPLSFSALHQVNWLLILGQAGKLGTILILIVISLLLNASGLELTARQDIDLNRELRSTGIANLVSGLGSGPVGYLALSLSVLGHKMESNSRMVGLLSAALCGATLFFGESLLSFLPKPVLGALLFFLGLSFLVEWVYDGWFKLPKADYFIVLLILFVIGIRGFLNGVGLGLVIAVILFVVKYSGVNVVKQTLSGANSASNVDRPTDHRRLLRKRGEELFILRLQGFIFFGTAHSLFRQVRERADDSHLPALHFVVLDFARVTGLDSSAEISFIKMMQLARSRDIKLICTHMTPALQSQLEKTVFTEKNRAAFRIFPDQDHGIEWCENHILTAENLLPAEEKQSLLTYLEKAFPESVDVSKMMQYLEKKEVGEGYYLMREGEASDDLYFIESGQVMAKMSAQTEPQNKSGDSESKSSKTIRLRTMQAGTVVGEVGMYLGIPRTATVVTNKPTTLYRLSASALRHMEEKDPEIASAFHQFIARLLAERLADNSRTIQALSD
jgi:SulP family sulfate permease